MLLTIIITAVLILAMFALAWHASTKVLDLQDRLDTSLRQAGLQLVDRRFIAATPAPAWPAP